MFITPPNAHTHIDDRVIEGRFLSSSFGFGGAHGATIAGMHGIGAPNAAATAGFAGDVHIPNGSMFMNGAKSVMVATGILPALIILAGRIISVPGANPNAHLTMVVNVGVGAGICFDK